MNKETLFKQPGKNLLQNVILVLSASPPDVVGTPDIHIWPLNPTYY